jgi:uncharacterized protein (TIGR04141 family)
MRFEERGEPQDPPSLRRPMARETNTPTQGLTVYLLKEGSESSGDVLREQSSLEFYDIKSGSTPIGKLYVQRNAPRPPPWARFFKNYLPTSQLGLVASSGAVLLMKASEKMFAITFGQGRHLLNADSWEERFGLRVALNSVGEGNLRSIDKRTFDAISRHSREQASREADARDFDFDIEQDLLRAITGTPTRSELGRRMSGMDALHIAVPTDIDSLSDLLSAYYEKYLDESYRQTFPWVDQITEISSRALVDELDEAVIQRISTGDMDSIWMAVPEVIQWERVEGFRWPGRRSPQHHDVHLQGFLDSLPNLQSLSKKALKQRKVECIDEDGRRTESWQAYRCLHVEMDRDGDSYLLSGGKWYRLTRDFVQEVNEAFSRLPRYKHNLPPYEDSTEGAYNERVAKSDPDRYVLMDRKDIPYGGGHGQVEFCDILVDGRDILHVKRYGASSVLSHLFSQALVSGELFQTDPEFRRRVNERLPERHRFEKTDPRPDPDRFHVVFCVISDVPGDLTLPFFSRLNLKHAARRLKGYGYLVSIAKIEVSEYYSKWKRYN